MIQITAHITLGGCRGYDSSEERALDEVALREEGYDHFTCYRDAQAEIAMQYARTPEAGYGHLKAKLQASLAPSCGSFTDEDMRSLRYCERIIMRRERDASAPRYPQRQVSLYKNPGYDLVNM